MSAVKKAEGDWPRQSMQMTLNCRKCDKKTALMAALDRLSPMVKSATQQQQQLSVSLSTVDA